MLKATIAAGVLGISLAASCPPVSAAPTADAKPPSVLTVHIRQFMFRPMSATIHAGDRVTFVNDDSEAHTATSTDKSFDSEGLDSGASWQHAFARAGTVTYFCELHPYMKATIVVLPAPAEGR